MRKTLAVIFKLLFKIKFFKKRYFGIHKKLFKPFNLFRGVIFRTRYDELLMSLHIDDFIQENLYFLGEYEKAELKAIHPFLTNDAVFIDIGANIGLYSLYASKLINEKGQIISFEPFSENFERLTKNVTLNGLSKIRLEKMAIGEKEGIINLYYDKREKNLGMVSTTPIETGIQEKVKVDSLDSYLKHKLFTKIDFIKIDIEGFEYSALLGMRDTLSTFSPSLLIEILNEDKSSTNMSNCDDLLKGLGYMKYFIDNDGGLSKNEINADRMNYIYTKKTVANN
jgi:FkbM family methyltransferase